MRDPNAPSGPPPLPPIPEKPKSGAVKTNIMPAPKGAFLEDTRPAAPPAALPKPVRPQDSTGTPRTGIRMAPTAAELGEEPAAPALPKPVRPQDKTGTSKTSMIQAPSADEIGGESTAATKAGPPPIVIKKPTTTPGVAKTVVRANARADFLLDDFAGDIDIPDEAAAELGVKPKDQPKK